VSNYLCKLILDFDSGRYRIVSRKDTLMTCDTYYLNDCHSFKRYLMTKKPMVNSK